MSAGQREQQTCCCKRVHIRRMMAASAKLLRCCQCHRTSHCSLYHAWATLIWLQNIESCISVLRPASSPLITLCSTQSQYAAEDYLYEERLDWAKLRKLMRIPSNLYNILQARASAITMPPCAFSVLCIVHKTAFQLLTAWHQRLLRIDRLMGLLNVVDTGIVAFW